MTDTLGLSDAVSLPREGAPIAARRMEGAPVARVLPDVIDTSSADSPPKKPKGSNIKPLLIGGVALAALAFAGTQVAHYVNVGRFMVSTDDAYVRTDLAIVAPKIAGYLDQVAVVDNQHVTAGQILARIDPGDYKLAVEAAARKIQTQDATINRIKTQVVAQNAAVDQAAAQIDSAKAEALRAEAELTRAKSLVASAFGTPQRLEQAQADRDRANASVVAAQAALAGARANLGVLRAQAAEAEGAKAEMATAQARAERDLGFAEVKAPFDGVVGNRAAQPGQFVQPGARLMALAPDGAYYVEANFKETQLEKLLPGQKAELRVDAYGGKVFKGEVESIAPASGSDYSLLPPENATGNFTKIIQRFPVRIKVEPAAEAVLRSGLSVIVDVDTRKP